MVVVIFRFSNPSTLKLGVEVLTLKPGTAETATTEAMRTTREARREEENIVRKVVKGGRPPLEPWTGRVGLKYHDLPGERQRPVAPKADMAIQKRNRTL